MDIIAQKTIWPDRLSAQETSENLRRFVKERLSQREAEIIHMRYGLDGVPPCTQREAAAVCGISRSYVSRRRNVSDGLEALQIKGLFAKNRQGIAPRLM